MAEINLITKEDFPNLKYRKIDWDVVGPNNAPYQVIKVKGHAHCIGGHLDYGDGNEFWCYPLNEEMSFDNLIEFNGHPGACWGFEYRPTHYWRNKWGESSIESGRHLVITRNGEKFYDGIMTIHECIAYVLDHKLDEHPLELNERGFNKNCIDRKIWYRSEPAVIESYVNGQACVIIAPDGIERFTTPPEFGDDEYYEDRNIKESIFSNHIWWFRD